MKNKIFLFGATSMPGFSLWRQYKNEVTPFCNDFVKESICKDWSRINLEKEDEYKDLFTKENPTHLIHAGGICDVDKIEQDPEWAYKINVVGLTYLLKHIPSSTRLVYISSDHVFSGDKPPYDENSQTDPLTQYGKMRVEAEKLVLAKNNSLVIRYALSIGPSYNGKIGHLDWLAYRTKNNLATTVVEDEFRSVVWGEDMAHRVMEYTLSPVNGLRHLVSEKSISRLVLAADLSRKFKIPTIIKSETREDRAVPHLGNVLLQTIYTDKLAEPLKSINESN